MLITNIVITKTSRKDNVVVYTNLPNPIFPFKGRLHMQFDAAQGTGEDYVKKYFKDIDVQVIET